MMSGILPRETEPDHEQRLAELVAALLDNAGDDTVPIDRDAGNLDALCQAHPAFAEELRAVWATARQVDWLAHTLDQEATVPTWPAAAEPTPTPGFEDYAILGEVGRGGMGVVYRAVQKSLGRTVALKMIVHPELAGSIGLARFRAEAEAAATLDHPAIVPIYEVGVAADPNGPPRPYFTMRLIEGTTLAARLADGPLPPRDAAQLLAAVARAVHFAHERGLIHRDLKPSNVLLDREGRAYVTDFGLVKRWESSADGTLPFKNRPLPFENRDSRIANWASSLEPLTTTGAIVGTPSYMAPEQAAGRKEIDPRSDVYALGAILYACLTGRPPFQGSTPTATLLMVLDHDPVPPRLINPLADADLELVARKALQKPPDLRYETAADFAAEMEAYLAHEPLAARSGRFRDVLSRALRETPHAVVLENWGLLWMLHAAALFALCVVTNGLQLGGVDSRWPYLLLWTVGLGIWAAIFWTLRRRAGPVTFVERQIAHVWAGSMTGSTLLYLVEYLLGLPVLTLAPVLGLLGGIVFLMKAAILSGRFYLQAAACFAAAVAMACWPYFGGPNLGILTFGLVNAACFFVPGARAWRQTRRERQLTPLRNTAA